MPPAVPMQCQCCQLALPVQQCYCPTALPDLLCCRYTTPASQQWPEESKCTTSTHKTITLLPPPMVPPTIAQLASLQLNRHGANSNKRCCCSSSQYQLVESHFPLQQHMHDILPPPPCNPLSTNTAMHCGKMQHSPCLPCSKTGSSSCQQASRQTTQI